jgi:ribonucleoside-diphosphate reductase alpha chain
VTDKFDVFSTSFANNIFKQKYSMNGQETWADTCERVVGAVTGQLLPSDLKNEVLQYMLDRKFIPGGRYLYSAGRDYHQVNNCFLLRAEDSREGWADAMQKATACLMTGGGIGFDYSGLRPEGALIRRTGGQSTGPIALMNMISEAGRYIMQGGARRSAIWAGLQWDHADVPNFLKLKDWSEPLRELKQKDFNFPLPMEGTNISVIYNTEFFVAMENKNHPKNKQARKIWLENCKQAFKTAEPGMSFNFCKDNESLRNACTEVVSSDDSDKCNLGTVWINRCSTREEFARVCHVATIFLLCGGIYSDVPTNKIKEVGLKNNRIGLGLGGLHEWLMLRKFDYEATPELHKWLNVYEQESDSAAYIWAKALGVQIPKGKRAIAPTGSIGILAETTTGIEPLFCKAYKRRYLDKNREWVHEYVVDGAVKRLLAAGISLDQIQDSFDIDFKARVKFQADVQQYVDMSISSTCNLPQWGSEFNNDETLDKYSKILLKYAKRLRGFTCYPDGARGGQPLTRVSLEEALSQEGKVFEESADICEIGKGGVCGS